MYIGGALEKPHYEQDEPRAAGSYDQFKLACETCIREQMGERGIIVRVPEIWGRDCPRLINLLRVYKEGKLISSYGNLFVNYTTDVQIARWISYVLEQDLRGTFHIGTRDMREYVAFHRDLFSSLQLQTPI